MVETARQDHIKVIIRSRPLSDEEKAARTPVLVRCDSETRSVSVATQLGSKRGKKTYNFDMAFGPYASQEEIYSSAIAPIVEEVLQGFNCTVFAYGQTGTGKTYTMEGDIDSPEKKGVIPRAVDSIFEQLKSKEEAEYSAKVSFLELYNEELQDLLSVDDEKKLRIVDDRSKINAGISCHNLEEAIVKSPEDIIVIMRKAMSKRQVAATKLNKSSSRSHCIFTLTVHIKETTPEGEDLLKIGKLNLVDLAGSESIGRSGAKDKRAREAGNINRSLLTLGRVISALVERTPHVPYRDSKLTRLLQESLGGKAKTCIIATVAPSVQCMDETLSTLDYASRAKNIKNRPEANQRMTKKALIREYADDIQRLRQELMSARAKDGVFLPEERYNSMVSDLESKTSLLEELEGTLETKQKELSELTSLFEDTSEKLQVSEAALSDTKSKLSATELELGGTKIELLTEKNKVKEGKIVLSAHKETEKLLQANSKALQETIVTISTDADELHSKIERKQKIEDSNKASSLNYKQATASALEAMDSTSSDFLSTHMTYLTNLRTNISDYNAKCAEEDKKLSAQVEAFAQDNGSARGALVDIVKAGAVELNENHLSQFESKLNANAEQSSQLVKESEELTRTTLQHVINDHLTAADENRKLLLEAMDRSMNEQKACMSEFRKEMTASLSSISEAVKAIGNENASALASQNDNLKAFIDNENSKAEQAVEDLKAQFSTLLSEFNKTRECRLSAEVNKSIEANEAMSEALTKDVDKVNAQVSSSIVKCDSFSTQLNARVESDSERNTELVQNIEEVLKSSGEQLSQCKSDNADRATKLVSEISGHVKESSSMCDAMRTSLAAVDSKIAERSNDDASKLSNSLSELQASVAAGTAKSNSWCESAAEEIEASKTGVEEFADGLSKSIARVHDGVQVFVETTLVQDVSTGSTPKKKVYAYPKEIPCTLPEPTILSNYRQNNGDGSPRFVRQRATSIDSPWSNREDKDTEDEENNPNRSNPNPDTVEKARDKRDSSVPPPKRNIVFSEGKSTSLSESAIMDFKVVELRRELAARGCPQFGTKAILRQRLLDFVSANS